MKPSSTGGPPNDSGLSGQRRPNGKTPADAFGPGRGLLGYQRQQQEPKAMFNAITKGIDTLIEKQGQLTSFLILPLTLIVLYEVLMRYAFNAPTVWGFEATTFLYGMHYMLGLSFMENAQGHVRVDIVTNLLPKRVQAAVMIAGYLLIFMPVYGVMTWGAAKFAYTATVSNELNSTSWAPRIWPFKIVMAVSFGFLVIQGLATVLKHLRSLAETSDT
jgi:TRAP-type mannitol/chloroaromatic compound transport system permease small subunit